MILFLDFDGVLHSATANDEELFRQRSLLWQVLREHTAIDVVFSTSWRETHTFDELVNIMTSCGGEDLAQRFVGALPSLIQERGAYLAGPYYRRYNECRLWLTGNNLQTRWVALDDDVASFPPGCENLIACIGRAGFTAKEADLLRMLLANSYSK